MTAHGSKVYYLEGAVCCGGNVGCNSDFGPRARRSVSMKEAVSRGSMGGYSSIRSASNTVR